MAIYNHDVVGYAVDCEVYCIDCIKRGMKEEGEESFPIYAGDEDEHTCYECSDIIGSC
jgi:hypothetical protein